MGNLNEFWDDVHLNYTSTYDGWLDKYLHLFESNSTFVELGCGRAYSSEWLLSKGFKDIIACDFSEEAIKIINTEMPNLKTMLFDMSQGLPFKDDSKSVIIADLCLHYFNEVTTKFLFNEIYRVLMPNGFLIARVNSTKDKEHIPVNAKEIENNFYYDGKIYKKFFEKDDFEVLLRNFEICNLKEKDMSRYEKPKVLWEICVKKIKNRDS